MRISLSIQLSLSLASDPGSVQYPFVESAAEMRITRIAQHWRLLAQTVHQERSHLAQQRAQQEILAWEQTKRAPSPSSAEAPEAVAPSRRARPLPELAATPPSPALQKIRNELQLLREARSTTLRSASPTSFRSPGSSRGRSSSPSRSLSPKSRLDKLSPAGKYQSAVTKTGELKTKLETKQEVAKMVKQAKLTAEEDGAGKQEVATARKERMRQEVLRMLREREELSE